MIKAGIQNRWISVIVYSLFGAWMLSFVYEGQILYALLGSYSFDATYLMFGVIFSIALGMFLCGFIVKTQAKARKCMLVCTIAGLMGSMVFFFQASFLWIVALPSIAFFVGLWNGCWGYFYKACSLPNQRMRTVAASMAGSTTLMIGLNMLAIHLRAWIGLLLAMLCLATSLYFTVQLPKESTENETLPPDSLSRISVRKPLTLLCLFILTITLTSGLMFQVITPAFAHLTILTSWYWAVPYIVAIIVVARLPKTINHGYVLYVALAMIGFGFLMFMLLDHSAGSYLIVNTLLLGTFGIMDLFWWSILGEMLDYHKNPSRVFGIGLAVNVVGVLFGELISKILSFAGVDNTPTIVSFGAVCVAVMVLPILQKNFSVVLKSNSFFYSLETMPPEKQKATVESFLHASELTEREQEITLLLLKGYTHHMIASELFISESTVKTHMQNIYYKYGVHNKTDLIYKLTK